MTLTWPVTSGSSLAGDADMESQGDRPHSYPLGESTAQGETRTKLDPWPHYLTRKPQQEHLIAGYCDATLCCGRYQRTGCHDVEWFSEVIEMVFDAKYFRYEVKGNNKWLTLIQNASRKRPDP